MDAKQQSTTRWREVVFLGDFFRLPPIRPFSTSKAEMHWHYFAESFFHLCRAPAAQGTKLAIRLVPHDDKARQKVRSFYAQKVKSSSSFDQNDWLCLCRQGVTEDACNFAREYILASSPHCKDLLVVGYSLSTFTTRVLTACGIDWINAHIHPASFLPDLIFAFSTNVPKISQTLSLNYLEDEEIKRCADWQKARYAPNAFLNYIPENALLILAQDWMDPLPLDQDYHYDYFTTHAQTLRDLSKQHSVTLVHVNYNGPYAPGPGLSEEDKTLFCQDLNAVLLPAPHIYLKNTVMLLSHPSISTVVGLNSKRLDEARWFGKKVVQLTPSPVSYSSDTPTAPGTQHALTPALSCCKANFWASIALGKTVPQTDAERKVDVQSMPNMRLIFRGGGSDFDDSSSCNLTTSVAQARSESALARQDLLLHSLRHVYEETAPTGPLPATATKQKDYALFCTGDENYLLPAIVALESTRRRTAQADAFFVTNADRLSDTGQTLLRKYTIKVLHSGDANKFTIRHLHTTPDAYVQLFVPEILYDLGYTFSLGVHADALCVQSFNPNKIFAITRYIAACAANPAARCYSVEDNHTCIEKELGLPTQKWFAPLNNPGVLFANNAALAKIQFAQQCAQAYAKIGPDFLLCNEETLLNFFCMLDEKFCTPLDDRFNMFNGSILKGSVPFFLHYLNNNKPWRFNPCAVHLSDKITPLRPLFSIWHREAKSILDECDYKTFIDTSGV